MSNPPISRYGGYVHSNPNYEDFETWNSVCEDAEPDWEYRNVQREAREQREREERAAARRQREREEAEQRERKQREEQERKEREARRALERKEAARKEQEKKEREQKEEEEEEQKVIRALVIKRMQEELKKMEKEEEALWEEALREEEAEVYWKLRRSQEELERTVNITKMGLEQAKQDLRESQRETGSYWGRSEAVHPGSQHEEATKDTRSFLGVHHNRNSDLEEEDAVLGAEDDRPQAKHETPVDPDLVFELDYVEDILRTMAESLRTEQEDRMKANEAKSVSNEDTTHTRPPAAGWSGGCILV